MSKSHEYLVPSIHPSYARLLVAHARNQGVSLDDLFRGNSLCWSTLLESQSFVSFEQFRRLLLQTQRLTGTSQIGLEISSISQASSHGPLGYGALSAPTLRETFALVLNMLATRITIIDLEYEDEADSAIFRVREKFALRELRLFVSITLLASFVDLISKTTGKECTEITVHLPREEHANKTAYETKFPWINFELGYDALEFVLPNELLSQSCLTLDEFAYRNALRECEQLLQQEVKGGAFVRRVKTYLLQRNGDLPTQQLAASDFAMSVRTFIRKLKLEESTYQQLLDEVRKELVVWYLSNDSLSIEQIALKVGYSDTSNFSRVFRRWFDQTPSQFRAEHI